MTCTWKGCTEEATTPQLDRDGCEWSNLCDSHAKELDESTNDPFDPKRSLRAWVRASGGAAVMAKKTCDKLGF